MFPPLPSDASQVKHGVFNVFLDDVECVTQTIIKVSGQPWYIKIARGNTYDSQVETRSLLNDRVEQQKFAEGDFVKLYSSWTSSAWDECDWPKVKDLQVRELLVQRQKVADMAENAKCLKCPNILKHVSGIGFSVAYCTNHEISTQCSTTNGSLRRTFNL